MAKWSNFGYTEVGVRCAYPEELASFGLVLW